MPRLLETREPVTLRHSYALPDGRMCVMEVTAAPILGPTGEVEEVIELSHDVTARVRAEQELSRRVGLEQTIRDVSSRFVGVSSEDLDATIDHALARLGAFASADRVYLFQLRGEPGHAENTHEWCRDGVAAHRETMRDLDLPAQLPWFHVRLMAGEAVVLGDVSALPEAARRERYHFQHQGIRSLLVVPLRVEGHILGFLGYDLVRECRTDLGDNETVFRLTAETISHALERERASRLLAEERERLNRIITAAQDAVVMMAPDGCISLWNPSAERVFGYTEAEALGRELHGLLAPERFHEHYRQAFTQFQQTGTGPAVGKVLELAALRKGGEEFPVEVGLSSVKLGGDWHAIGVLRDITERKQAEEALRLVNQHLEETTARANALAAEAAMALNTEK